MLQTATRFVELDFCHAGHAKGAAQTSTKPIPFPGALPSTLSKHNVHSKHAAIVGLGDKYIELALF